MKRKLFALLFVVIFATSMMFGCGSSGRSASTDDDSSGSDGITDEEVTLTVWESAEVEDFIVAAGEAFTELYPNITIEYVNVELADSTSQIALDGPAGVGPDLFAAPHDKLGVLVEAGHVLETDLDDDTLSSILETCQEALDYDGVMYGYPVSVETYALFYNEDLLSADEVPTSWDEVIEMGSSWTDSDYFIGFNVGSGYYVIPFCTYNGNYPFGYDGLETSTSYLLTDDCVAGMEQFQELRTVLNSPSADLSTSAVKSLFTNGNLAIFVSGLWDIESFEEAGINVGAATMPSLLDEDTPSVTFNGTRAMFVSAYSKNQNEANAFAQFLMTDEMQELRYEMTGTMPATDIEVEGDYLDVFYEQLEYSYPMFKNVEAEAYWASFNAACANIWDGADIVEEFEAVDSTVTSSAE